MGAEGRTMNWQRVFCSTGRAQDPFVTPAKLILLYVAGLDTSSHLLLQGNKEPTSQGSGPSIASSSPHFIFYSLKSCPLYEGSSSHLLHEPLMTSQPIGASFCSVLCHSLAEDLGQSFHLPEPQHTGTVESHSPQGCSED